MEDFNLTPERGEQAKHGDDNEKPATVKYEAMTAGFVKHLFHSLVSAEEIQKNEEQEKGGSGSRVSEEEAMKNGGDGESEEVSGIRNGDSVDGGGKGGKIISDFISNVFHQGEDDGKERNKEELRTEAEEIKVNENGGAGVGAIINNVVSHLPASLPDDAAPTTDEATVLIHSIAHDWNRSSASFSVISLSRCSSLPASPHLQRLYALLPNFTHLSYSNHLVKLRLDTNYVWRIDKTD